jgi:hypothetical protein
MPKPIYGDPVLFGHPDVVGYAGPVLRVETIPKREADALVRQNHYSGSVVWSSSLHLGCFVGDDLIGALQFGVAMNPASGAKVVAGTEPDQWLELNRMWLSDVRPEHAASRAVSLALRTVKRVRPRIGWVQTFADERCGKMGSIYQACSFDYLGCHDTNFWLLDGEWYHQSMLGRPEYDGRGWWCGPKISHLNNNRDRAERHTFTQYRYFKALHGWAAKNLLLERLPYPKPDRIG